MLTEVKKYVSSNTVIHLYTLTLIIRIIIINVLETTVTRKILAVTAVTDTSSDPKVTKGMDIYEISFEVSHLIILMIIITLNYLFYSF